MTKRYCILDCYVDEPACFGVPPFISPYPRYIYGALAESGVDGSRIDYLTIDTIRTCEYRIDKDYEWVFIIGGAVVPGKYLGSRIGTASEIHRIIRSNTTQEFAVGGLISRVIRGARNAVPVLNDIEKFANGAAGGHPSDAPRSVAEIARWSVRGAAAVRAHPRFPDVICEIETYRGCPRESHCSFCSEGLFGAVEYREPEDILAEIDALISCGVSRFRLGRQADILQYKSDFSMRRKGFPRPEVAPIASLLAELNSRKSRGLISVLNIDNANPGTIAAFPDESSRILEALAGAVTPGDTLALGIESFDENVARLNNLKVDGDEAAAVIETVNRIGGNRVDSIPVLLPGVNLIHGLAGESMTTFELNYRWLAKIMERGLLIKRINIRRLQPFPGTAAYLSAPRRTKRVENRFRYYREKIRGEIEHEMLRKIYPVGTIIRASQVLDVRAGYSYGKQIGSYAITAKFPMELSHGSFHDAIVIGHRERSLVTLPIPIPVNTLPQKALELIPGIGEKKATEIILRRPFSTVDEAMIFFKEVDGAISGRLLID